MATNLDKDLHVVTENGEQCFMWRSNQLTYIAQDRQELPQILAVKFGALATKLDLSYNSMINFDNINLFTNLSELILDNNNFEDNHLEFRQNLRLKTLSLNKNKLTNLYKLVRAIKLNFPNLEYLSLIGNPLCPVSLFGCQMAVPPPPPSEQREDEENELAFRTQGGVGGRESTATTTRQQTLTIDELILGDATNCNGQVSRRRSRPGGQQADTLDMSYQKYRHFIIYHLPNLRFLDSAPISARERDEALRRCFWMGRQAVGQQVSSEQIRMQNDSLLGDNGGRDNRGRQLVGERQNSNDEEFKLSIMCSSEKEQQLSSACTFEQTPKVGRLLRVKSGQLLTAYCFERMRQIPSAK